MHGQYCSILPMPPHLNLREKNSNPGDSQFENKLLEGTPTLHVLTVSSREDPGLNQLLHSAKIHHFDIRVMGVGLPYSGNGHKLSYAKYYLSTLPVGDLFLFVDAFDVLFLADREVLIQKFLAFSSPFVISAEKGCHPFNHLAEQYPESPTPFRFINSGTYMGYVGFIRDLLENMGQIANGSDQGQLTTYFLKNQGEFCLDYYCELFLPLEMVNEEDLLINCAQGKVQCLITGSTPCIVHGNGNGKGIYQSLYDNFFLSGMHRP